MDEISISGRITLKRPYFFCVFALVLFVFSLFSAAAQEIIPASRFFESLSSTYGDIADYKADLVITKGETILEGVVFYKSPNLLRINFSQPEDQVIVVNNENLMIYLPDKSVVMTQKLREKSETTPAARASEKGLRLLAQGYSISYLSSPDPVPLVEGSNEMVVKLRLEWRTTDEGFRQIIMSVGQNNMIRRMEGITTTYDTVVFDFTNIRTNQNIPEARFDFEPPASAYEMHNFLFESIE